MTRGTIADFLNLPGVQQAIDEGRIVISNPKEEQTTIREVLNGTMTEADFTQQLIDYAQLHGWKTAHFRPGRTGNGGWTTAVSGDGKGFPDLVLVRDRVVWAELKVGYNKPTPEQREWLAALGRASQEYYLWYPEDWPEIRRVLACRRPMDLPKMN